MNTKPKQPITKSDAQKVMDTEIRRIMTERKVNYPDAFTILQKEESGFVEGYKTIMNRSK